MHCIDACNLWFARRHCGLRFAIRKRRPSLRVAVCLRCFWAPWPSYDFRFAIWFVVYGLCVRFAVGSMVSRRFVWYVLVVKLLNFCRVRPKFRRSAGLPFWQLRLTSYSPTLPFAYRLSVGAGPRRGQDAAEGGSSHVSAPEVPASRNSPWFKKLACCLAPCLPCSPALKVKTLDRISCRSSWAFERS